MKMVCFLRVPKRGMLCRATQGSNHGWSGGREERMSKNLHCGFCGKVDRPGMGKFE